MRATDLIERLQDLVDEFGDLDVLVAHQPSYPLEARPNNVTVCPRAGDDARPAIYIACAGSSEYAPRAAWDDEPTLPDEAQTRVHEGKTYYATGKTGTHEPDGSPIVEMEASDAARIWVAEDGRMWPDIVEPATWWEE